MPIPTSFGDLQSLMAGVGESITRSLSTFIIGDSLLVLLFIGYKMSVRIVSNLMQKRHRTPGQIQMARLVIKYAFYFVGLIFLLATPENALKDAQRRAEAQYREFWGAAK